MKFSVKCSEVFEQAFQDFFVAMMVTKHGSAFLPVVPWGRIGDLKCDGYLTSARNVFQVYAPHKMVQATCVKKVREDHKGAVKHWREHMSQWTFVHNNHGGLPPQVVILLANLKTKYDWLSVNSWDREALRLEVRGLTSAQLTNLFGDVPDTRSGPPRQEDLHRAIRQLAAAIDAKQPSPLEIVREVPAAKLEFNNLGHSARHLLRTGATFSARVRTHLDRDPDPKLGGRIASGFRTRYKELRDQSRLPPDELFAELLRFAGVGDDSKVPEMNAALAVLAYLFETCHIFEAPK